MSDELPTREEIEEMEWRIVIDRAIVRRNYPNGLAAKIHECRERDRLAEAGREAKGDREQKAGDRYGGADLPVTKPGTNERGFYDVRNKPKEG
jgi:hypothetical protein